ncbi:YphA family membrane protein [Priestia koreensis]|uniref:YphA family membrane protein n=1 Tax=Priestia koreensis TaxID=284581 RepID=UPI001F570F84|nr:hypothetical protein [Priestia koreensis]MCM3003930.1 hypothetical protein [Priestia koreensis]UNL84029.1 hypothetical protein IE339_17975 [Priestia koreensis]
MEGIFFYWFSWIGWTILTFFKEEGRERLIYVYILLLSIIASTIKVEVGPFLVSGTLVVLLISCYSRLTYYDRALKVRMGIITVILSLAYASYLLFEMYDPVWFFLDRRFALALLLAYVTCILLKEFEHRLIGLVVGAGQGDFLYSYILSPYTDYQVGALSFLDIAANAVMMVLVWQGIAYGVEYVNRYTRSQARQSVSNK